jgi:hypothetical protein
MTMADQTKKLALTLLKDSAKGKVAGRFVSSDGEQYATFDAALVRAFTEHDLTGKERDYLVREPKEQKYSPSIVGIPGVYDAPRGGAWRSGGSAGPMLTDRQAALFAAVQFDAVGDEGAVITTAERFFKWLQAGSQQGQAALSRPTMAGRSDTTTRKEAAPAAPPVELPDHSLVEHALKVWPDRPNLVASWLKAALKRMSALTIDALTDEQVSALDAELDSIGGTAAEG